MPTASTPFWNGTTAVSIASSGLIAAAAASRSYILTATSTMSTRPVAVASSVQPDRLQLQVAGLRQHPQARLAPWPRHGRRGR